MSRKAPSREDAFGFKRSSGVDYNKVQNRHIEDERFQRQRALREGSAPPTPAPAGPKTGTQSATMDAVMRMLTGKEERTIADRISDPNRPTWEQYKKENADKLDLTDDGAKEMRAYRKQLDAARKKAMSKRSGSSSKKSKNHKRSYSSSSSSESDSDSDDESDSDGRRRSSSRKSRKKSKKSRKRRRASSSSDSDTSDDGGSSDSDPDRRRSRKHSRKSSSKKSKKKSHKKHKKASSNDKSGEHSPSPVRLSAFLQGQGSDSN